MAEGRVWADARIEWIVAIPQGDHVGPVLVDVSAKLIARADGSVSRNEDVGLGGDVLEAAQRVEVMGPLTITALVCMKSLWCTSTFSVIRVSTTAVLG